MQSIQTLFSTTIEENLNSDNLENILKDITFELSKRRLQRLKDKTKIQHRAGELFELYCKILEEKNLKNSKNISAVIDGLTKALTYEKEEFLYKMIYEKEQLEKSILNQKNEIKDTIKETYKTIEKHIDTLPEEIQNSAKEALSDIKLSGLEMLGILRETAEEAILTTLEKGSDIQDTIQEITKNLTYQAINDGDFTKRRFLDISNTIISVATEIANENISLAKEIINGSIEGTKNGILKAVNKFKNDIKFAPEEIEDISGTNLLEIKKELLKIEEEFIDMLKEFSSSISGISKEILSEKIKQLDTSTMKLKRAAQETAEAIAQKIEELKEDISINDIKEKAEERFETLKKDVANLEKKAGEKLETLKKDVANLEKKAEEKFEEIKKSERTKQATNEAKKLGLRAWEIAKSMLNNTIKKDEKPKD